MVVGWHVAPDEEGDAESTFGGAMHKEGHSSVFVAEEGMYDRAVEKRRELRLHVPEGPHRFVDRLVTSAPYKELIRQTTRAVLDGVLDELKTNEKLAEPITEHLSAKEQRNIEDKVVLQKVDTTLREIAKQCFYAAESDQIESQWNSKKSTTLEEHLRHCQRSYLKEIVELRNRLRATDPRFDPFTDEDVHKVFFFDPGLYFNDHARELMKEALDEKLRLALGMNYTPPEKKVEEEVVSKGPPPPPREDRNSDEIKRLKAKIKELMEIIEQQKEDIETEQYKRQQVEAKLEKQIQETEMVKGQLAAKVEELKEEKSKVSQLEKEKKKLEKEVNEQKEEVK